MRRRKRRKQRKIIIITSIALLFVLATGYAAFQTNLNITAKGNILEKGIRPIELKNNVVTSGQGLYLDNLENNRYVYKGENPNNYIWFNNELWRIIAIENDNTLKIIRNESDDTVLYDSAYSTSSGRRFNLSTTYCKTFADSNTYYGCNAWNSVSGNYTSSGVTGTVTEDAELNIYFNQTFYNSINIKDRQLITRHKFYKGPINGVADSISPGLTDIINDEKTDSWTGLIGLPNLSDWYKASSNPECLNSKTEFCCNNKDFKCKINNYIYQDQFILFMSPDNRKNYTHALITFSPDDGILGGSANSGKINRRQTLYITADILLSGDGSEKNPYQII